MLAEAEASGAEGQGELWSMGPCVNDNWRHTHTFLIPKWPLCPNSSLMPALLPPILLVTKTPSFQEARGISRDVAVSHVFDNNVTAQSLCSWREKCLGLRRAAKGQLGQPPGCVRTCSNRLPRWWKHGESAEEIQAATCRRGDCYSGAIFGRCLLFEEVGGPLLAVIASCARNSW